MVIRQGEIYWIELDEPVGSEPGYRHPHVVVQNDVFNQSRMNTVIVCALSSNLKRAGQPGNVELKKGEGGLTKPSVVLVTQVFTVDKIQLAEQIGQLSERRVQQILDGLDLVLKTRDIDTE